MNIFKSDTDSHQHSLETLNLIANYDDFMDSITTICDMGCGVGLDLAWWATKTYLDENGAERREQDDREDGHGEDLFAPGDDLGGRARLPRPRQEHRTWDTR